MKIKIFTNHFYPENFRINDLAASFVEEGHKVSVLSQTPNYPKGRFFPGYSIFKRRKEKLADNFEVRRLPVIPRGSNAFMLALNYLSYIVSSFFYAVFSRDEADMVMIYITSPIFISWSALRFAKKRSLPTVLYLLDLWPDVLFTMLNIQNKRIRNIFTRISQKIYQQVDYIFVSSYAFKDVLIDYGIEANKIHYLPQHAEEIPEEIPERSVSNEKLKIVFTGNIGEAQGLDILIDTAAILKEQGEENVQFSIVGDGRYRQSFQEKIKTAQLDNYFYFTGRVNFKEIPKILSEHHLGFVSLLADETLNKTLPAKVQTYMAYGIPVLASADMETARVLEEARCGFSSPAGDAKALSEEIIRLKMYSEEEFQKLSVNAHAYSRAFFTKEQSVETILNTMEGLIDV